MTFQGVASYILKTYSEECHNVEDCIKFFYEHKLCWCWCGVTGVAKRAVRDLLAILYDFRKGADDYFNGACERKRRNLKERFGSEIVYMNELLVCLLYTLDAAGLIEHDFRIGCAGISKEGEMFLWVLNQSSEVNDAEDGSLRVTTHYGEQRHLRPIRKWG